MKKENCDFLTKLLKKAKELALKSKDPKILSKIKDRTHY